MPADEHELWEEHREALEIVEQRAARLTCLRAATWVGPGGLTTSEQSRAPRDR